MAKKTKGTKKTEKTSPVVGPKSDPEARGKTDTASKSKPGTPTVADAPTQPAAEKPRDEKRHEIRSPALKDLAADLRLELPSPLLPALAERGIRTLEDVRNTGGINHIEGLPIASVRLTAGVSREPANMNGGNGAREWILHSR